MYSLELTVKRRETAREFSAVFEPLYMEITGLTGIGVNYLPSCKEESLDAVISLLTEKRGTDASMGVSLRGPTATAIILRGRGRSFRQRLPQAKDGF